MQHPISLVDFAKHHNFHQEQRPVWSFAAAKDPLPDAIEDHVEDILDTIVSVQRADWLEDGVQVGPGAYQEVYRTLMDVCALLKVPVPPAIIAGCSLASQGIYGTDRRSFLYLSTFYFDAADEAERRFLAGRFVGQQALSQVTAQTLYALLVDQGGLRTVATKAVGPLVEVVLTPLSLGLRFMLARWHRAAVFDADRAGLIAAGSLQSAGSALLRLSLGKGHEVNINTYLAQVKAEDLSPAKWTQLFASNPWTYKRIVALQLFTQSELWQNITKEEITAPISAEELEKRTVRLLGVAS